ncbi:putative membrane protein [Nocardioides daedukensis]|uniref:Putative membrane protein n=1 Tax=Nocardioides daedukensis TaxID=634462 RepID=A0A7Y9UR34_9ACTN|nr:putative membrane protein [Nocardioides daedukensis]
MASSRWPAFVYDEGEEPDYRFSLANERTFLAWIRTSLALLAAGVAVDVVDLSLSATSQHLLAVLLVSAGLVTSVASWVRWALAERAMRRREPLPSFGTGLTFTLVVVAAAIVVLIGLT